MILKLKTQQLDFINSRLPEDSLTLYSRFCKGMSNNNIIDLDEETISEIRDWAGLKLQQIGFDEDYNPTKEGLILEDIIDSLYL